MPQFGMDAESYLFLKHHAKEQGVPMAAVLRTIIADYASGLPPIPSTADVRARGVWYVKAYLWLDGGLERETDILQIANTAELPALAESFVGVPGVASLVLADLPRLRQVLARVHSTSARIPNNDGSMILQIDVHRDRPAE